jgi:S1-C subfamily serine protease
VGLALRGLALSLVAALAAIVAWKNIDLGRWQAGRNPAAARPVHRPPAKQTAALPGPSLAAALALVEPSVVLIEADGPGGLQGIGSGFVIDPAGRIATSLHVASEAVAGVARFGDGRVFEIAGYAAVDPENDLAILQLRTGGSTLAALRLADADPLPLAPIVAIGHPQGVEFSPFDGKVSRVVSSSDLSVPAQKFVRSLTGGATEQRWIQHTAKLSDGNSGGPLVGERGRVLGVNTWVDRQTGFGYALHAAALARLMQRPLPEVEPLERHATTEARLRALAWQSSAGHLSELLEAARAMRWSPSSRAEYAQLQALAWALTVANQPDLFSARTSLGDKLDELVRVADQAAAEIRRQKWNDVGQITILNEYAEREMARPMAGLAFFGTIERVVQGSGGERGAIVRLAGFERQMFLPLTGRLLLPEAGQQCFLIGVNDRGRSLSYGDNPLQPHVLPILRAPLIVPLDK